MEVDALVFQRAPESLDEDVVHPPAPAVHADADFGVTQHAGEGEAGKLAALSVLKISGRPKRASASSSAVTQKPASIVFDSCQARTLRVAQSMIATR